MVDEVLLRDGPCVAAYHLDGSQIDEEKEAEEQP